MPLLLCMENRDRHDVQDKLVQATRNCTNFYAKGKRSFEVLAKLTDTRHFGEAPAKLWQNPAHSGSEVGINAGHKRGDRRNVFYVSRARKRSVCPRVPPPAFPAAAFTETWSFGTHAGALQSLRDLSRVRPPSSIAPGARASFGMAAPPRSNSRRCNRFWRRRCWLWSAPAITLRARHSGPSLSRRPRALASYVRTILMGDSTYDHYLAGQRSAPTEAA